MKFMIFGAGVLGCNLANNLFRAGKDVTLLARGPWAEEIRSNGLRVKNSISRRTAVSRIPVAAELSSEEPYDVIFVAVRYTQIETLRASRAKTIIFVGNNVRAAGHRESNYVDSVDLRKITVGPLRGAPSQEELVQEIFAGTKYKVTYEPNMEDYLLCHAAFVLPAVFACYKTDGDLKKLKKDNPLRHPVHFAEDMLHYVCTVHDFRIVPQLSAGDDLLRRNREILYLLR
jgi:2-dehydropantoate 2-reductase